VPEFDTLMDQAYAETDAAKRATLLKAAVNAYVQDVPEIYILATQSYVVASPKLKETTVGATPFWRLDNVYRVE
jgi:ABC-type transport system substrate-binding protein